VWLSEPCKKLFFWGGDPGNTVPMKMERPNSSRPKGLPAFAREHLFGSRSALVVACLFASCVRYGFEPARNSDDTGSLSKGDFGLDSNTESDTTMSSDGDTISSPPCSGTITYSSSSLPETDGEHVFEVTEQMKDCLFSFVVKGAGGGYANGNARGGHGGLNSFDFIPGQAGTLVMVVGGGGSGSTVHLDGGSGGGASSVMFDPALIADRTDAFTLGIAGGGGGEGGSVGGTSADDGGDGNGDGPGGVVYGAPGTGAGTCNTWGDCCSGSCITSLSYCQGGRGGVGSGHTSGGVPGGFGKGGGRGGDAAFGGGGGGGFGGGAGARYNGPGGGGAGAVFTVEAPSSIVNTTPPATSLGGGGRGANSADGPTGEDGSIEATIAPAS